MIKPHQTSLKDALFVSTIPLFIKGVSFLLKGLQEGFFSQNASGEYHFISWINDGLNQLISTIYSDYLLFMTTMIALSLLISLIKMIFLRNQEQGMDLKPSKDPSSLNASRVKRSVFSLRELFKTCGKLMICYTLIFSLIRCTSMVTTNSSFNQRDIQVGEEIFAKTKRNLEQIPNEEGDSEALRAISTIYGGEILGYFPYEHSEEAGKIAFCLAKDEKTLFVIKGPELSIFDISNPKKKQVIAIQEFQGLKPFEWASMVVSPDGQFLYLLSNRNSAIIEISTQNGPALRYIEADDLDPRSFSSLALSSDGKILYLLKNGDLNFYNVSQPSSPKLIYSKSSDRTLQLYVPKMSPRIAVSKDGTRIAIAFAEVFEILDISDPSKPVSVFSRSESKNFPLVFSIAFSDDQNKLLLGTLKSFLTVSLSVLDIGNLKSPSILLDVKIYEVQSLGYDTVFPNLWFHPSLPFGFFLIRNELRIVSVAEKEQVVLLSFPSDVEYKYLAISADGTKCFVHYSDRIIIIKTNVGLAPKAFFEFIPNTLKVIDESIPEKKLTIGLSNDGKNLYILNDSDKRISESVLTPYQRSTNVSLVKLNQLEFNSPTQYLFSKFATIIAGKNIVVIDYLSWVSGIYVINAADKNKISMVASFSEKSLGKSQIPAIALPEDERFIAFIHCQYEQDRNITLNIMPLNAQKPVVQTSLKIPSEDSWQFYPSLKTNKNGTLIFYSDRNLLIYNTSDLKSPRLQSSYDLEVAQTIEFTLSKNEKVLYHFGIDNYLKKKLQILDISSSSETPTLLSSIFIDQECDSTNSIELSPDEKILYLGFENGMLMVNVHIPSRPVLFGFNYYLGVQHALKFVPNEQIFYAVSNSGVTVVDITSQYLLGLKSAHFKIGGSYSIRPDVLKLNKNLTFDWMIKKHKFVKITLLNGNIASNAEDSIGLPGWINFDKERSILVFDPKSTLSNTIENYTMSAIVSLQIQPSSFIGLESIAVEDDAQNLMQNLNQNGYIDNEGFISGKLDFNKQLWIDPKYKNINKDVRAILAQSYIRAFGEFSVSPSLNISFESKHLAISTLSKGIISVTIQLVGTKNGKAPRFLNKAYSNLKPTINQNSLLLFGSLENVNEALKEVLIDFDPLQPSNATIHVSDGINPSISRDISSLGKYFIENKDPIYNRVNSLQTQLDTKQPFSTGSYSGIRFDQETFKDENNLTLEYYLEMPNAKEHIPSWISLRGLDLVATPPEKFWTLSYNFVLVAKNEFRKVSIPFTLNVKISFSYGLRLFTTLLGYIVSGVGAYYSRNKILNIIARKRGRYPRSFKLKVGKQITDKDLFPLSLIQEEIKESRSLFKELERYVTQQKIKLLDYFIDPELKVLEKEKVISTLELLKNNSYNRAEQFSREIIQQIVINTLVEKQLASPQEKITRETFNQMKHQWMDLVTVTTGTKSSSSLQFSINSDRLQQELDKISPSDQEGSDSLLEKTKINIDLLQNALLAHAFNFQNLDIDSVSICVASYQKLKGKSLWLMVKRLLIRDLKPFASLGSRELGYGIKYEIEDSIIRFSGQLACGIKDNVVVIHLKGKGDKILREMSITREMTKDQENHYIEVVSDAL